MTSTIFLNWLTIFVRKLKKWCSLDHTILFKSIFAVNLSLKILPCSRANVDIGSLKSLRTFKNICTTLNKMVKFKFLNFLTKKKKKKKNPGVLKPGLIKL